MRRKLARYARLGPGRFLRPICPSLTVAQQEALTFIPRPQPDLSPADGLRWNRGCATGLKRCGYRLPALVHRSAFAEAMPWPCSRQGLAKRLGPVLEQMRGDTKKIKHYDRLIQATQETSIQKHKR